MSQVSNTPPALRRILARPSERLTTHTREVVNRIGQLSSMHPLPNYPRLWARLQWAALLHDSGKLAAGFQRQLRSRKARWGLRHEVLSLAVLGWFAFDDDDFQWVAAAIATHHRDAESILTNYVPYGDEDVVAGMVAEVTSETARAWYDWLSVEAAHLPDSMASMPFTPLTPSCVHRALARLQALIDRIEEDTTARDEATLMRGFLRMADCAGAALAPPFTIASIDHTRLLPGSNEAALYSHQRACASAGNRSVLLTAPTGSGKTEAAFLWAACGQMPPRIYYLLPYRASIDAMTARLARIAGDHAVGATHGRILNTLYRQMEATGVNAEDALAEARARTNLARLHTYPIRVTTPYHLLRAVYQFDGFESALADLQDARVIIDEIHAYEPARLAQIIATLGFLRDHHRVQLIIMTATLPPLVREVLAQTLPDLMPIGADALLNAQFRRHRLHLRAGDLLDALDEIVTSPGRRLITVNTVRRANQVTAALRARGANTLTLHSRFTARDRWMHERRLMERFATGTRGRDEAVSPPIVVATQVVEVSLDLDFDSLYSDPAPLDALLQRFGRVNRRRNPPALAPVYVFSQPTGEDDRHPVYDPELVKRTLDILRQRDGDAIDEAGIEPLLAQVYTGEIALAWLERYRVAYADFTRAVLEPLRPFVAADRGLMIAFARLFDGIDVLPLTLEDEFDRAANPIEAAALFVPISYGQYRMLEGQGLAWEEAYRFMVDMPYSPEDGLLLDTVTESEDE